MATVPSQFTITDTEYTRVVSNSTTYLVQNVGNSILLTAESDADLTV